jgi:hypothetical protein
MPTAALRATPGWRRLHGGVVDTANRPGREGVGLVAEILVEVRPANVSGDIARRTPAVPESFASRAGDVADTLTDVAGKLRDHLEANLGADDSHLWRLTTVELGFELSLQAEAEVILITWASTEATFSASLTWSRGTTG